MIIKLIREGLGRVFVFADFISRPKMVERSAEAQQEVEKKTRALSLYQFHACPFCIKTRRVIRQLNLPIDLKDAQQPGQYRDELASQGGRIKVPCLRIQDGSEDRWLYESNDIIAYLRQNFTPAN